MTNDTVMRLVREMQAVIAKNPSAPFYSVSQNDDAVYCECKQCKSINKSGGPQGSLYYFLNKIAKHFPKTKNNNTRLSSLISLL
jgi:hypothetical protein